MWVFVSDKSEVKTPLKKDQRTPFHFRASERKKDEHRSGKNTTEYSISVFVLMKQRIIILALHLSSRENAARVCFCVLFFLLVKMCAFRLLGLLLMSLKLPSIKTIPHSFFKKGV